MPEPTRRLPRLHCDPPTVPRRRPPGGGRVAGIHRALRLRGAASAAMRAARRSDLRRRRRRARGRDAGQRSARPTSTWWPSRTRIRSIVRPPRLPRPDAGMPRPSQRRRPQATKGRARPGSLADRGRGHRERNAALAGARRRDHAVLLPRTTRRSTSPNMRGQRGLRGRRRERSSGRAGATTVAASWSRSTTATGCTPSTTTWERSLVGVGASGDPRPAHCLGRLHRHVHRAACPLPGDRSAASSSTRCATSRPAASLRAPAHGTG